MTNPVYKIEVWEPGAGSALYTFTNDTLDIYFKTALTTEIGSFTFTTPTRKGSTYYYNDIDLYDTVKIWLGYDSISGDPNFIGKVTRITAPFSSSSGFIRLISGLDQGEILLRRQKSNYYHVLQAGTWAGNLATDLSIYHIADVDSNTTNIGLNVDTETYFDLFRRISDYWYDAATKVQKDFFVDVDGHLHWKARPIRTVGVETLTVGGNVEEYKVIRDIESVRNNITVYGKQAKTIPANQDSWTEATTNWTVSSDGGGETVAADTDRVVGSFSIKGDVVAGSTYLSLKRQITSQSVQHNKDPHNLHFWFKVSLGACNGNYDLRLYAPDAANYYDYGMRLCAENQWIEFNAPVGPNFESPNGPWGVNGSPSWSDIQYIVFWTQCLAGGSHSIWIDELYFGMQRYSGTASDATSQTNYGRRDFEITDDKLQLDDDCTKRANTLLMQYKDPTIQLETKTAGNMNIKIGDRLPMTIPAENITATNFDVIGVEHFLNVQGFRTKATMVNSSVSRMFQPTNIRDIVANIQRVLNTVAKGEQVV